MKSRAEAYSGGVTLAPAARTAAATGTGVELKDVVGCELVLSAGAMTDGTHTFTVQESTDNSTWTDVEARHLPDGGFDAIDADSDNTVQIVGYTGIARYVRVNVAAAGTTTGGVYGVSVLRKVARV